LITRAGVKVSEDGKVLIGGTDVTRDLTQMMDREKGVLKGIEDLKQFQNDSKSFMKILAKEMGISIDNIDDNQLARNIASKLKSINPEGATRWTKFTDQIMANPAKSIFGLSVLGYMISTGDMDPIHAILKVAGKDTQAAFQSVFGDHWKLIFWIITGGFLLVLIVLLIAKTRRTFRNVNKF